MNNQIHEATGTSPYEVVFGQKPRSVVFPSQTAVGFILEEELEMEGVCCTSDEGQENGVDCKCEEKTTQDEKIEERRTEEGENGVEEGEGAERKEPRMAGSRKKRRKKLRRKRKEG